jgi:choline monooxygenase
MSKLIVDPRLERASTLPASWYFDSALYERERRYVFGRTWQYVCHASRVAAPGDYATFDIAGEPVVVARGQDGVLRAFSNVCRHRAGPTAVGCGNARSLRCGYHGWTYGLDGRLIGTPEFEGVEDFDRAHFGLPPVDVDCWGPFVFVRIEASGVSLAEFLGELPERCAPFDLQTPVLAERRDYFIDCNWKVYVDNYLEGYHIPIVHPGLMRDLDYARYWTETFRYFSLQHAPLRPADPAAAGSRRYADAGEDDAVLYVWLFPNLMLNIYPDNYSVNLILPLDVGRTVTTFEWYFDPAKDADLARTVEFSDVIQQEDIEICLHVQKGLRSRSYDRGRYSVMRENGVHHFHGLIGEFLDAEQRC